MNWIQKRCFHDISVETGARIFNSLLFVGDVVLQAPTKSDLLQALDHLVAGCNSDEIKMSIKKTELLHL